MHAFVLDFFEVSMIFVGNFVDLVE